MNASTSVAGWSVSASRSRSPIDSLRRRNEPAGSMRQHAGRRRQRRHEAGHQLLGTVEPHPVEPLIELGDALQDERLGPWRHPAQAAQAPALGRGAEVVDRLDAEIRVELADGLGSEPRDPQQLDEARRDLGTEPVVVGHVAGRDELADLVADRLADARDRRRVARAVGRHEVDRAAPDGVGGSVVGDGLEHELALQLEHVADGVEDAGEVAVGQVSRRSGRRRTGRPFRRRAHRWGRRSPRGW